MLGEEQTRPGSRRWKWRALTGLVGRGGAAGVINWQEREVDV